MASAFSHAAAALALGTVILPRPWRWPLFVLGAGCAILPDADVVGFAIGIRYSHLVGHRGLSHSLAFAAVTATVATLALRRSWDARVWLFLLVATASHGLLDALTDGGLGVAFFAPWIGSRYFFPWRPIVVSPILPAEFFEWRSLRVLASEALVVGVPSLVLVLAALFARGIWFPTTGHRRAGRATGRQPSRGRMGGTGVAT
jgi:inner membrane protein